MTSVVLIHQTSNYPPMGSLYLADALEQNKIHCELMRVSCSTEEFDSLIKKCNPVCVAFSVITGPEIVSFVRHSKYVKEKYPKIKVVWGGVHPSLNPVQCLKEDYIDLVITGQAEETFPKAVAQIKAGTLSEKLIRGMGTKNLDKFRPRWDKLDLTKFVFPEEHAVHSLGKLSYDKNREKKVNNIFYYIITSRGCPYKCTFCSEPLGAINGAEGKSFSWNAHSYEWFKEQFEFLESELIKKGIKLDGIGIWDDMFWIDMERAYKILDYLKGKRVGSLIEARADQLLRNDGELLKKLADVGCIQVFVGAESADQNTLNYLKKGTKVEDYYKLMEMAEEYGIAIRLSLIVGFPHETDESVNRTLDFAKEVNKEKKKFASVSGPKLFTPYLGTIEYNRAIERGLHVPKNTEEWGHIHRRTNSFLKRFPWLKANLSKSTLSRLVEMFSEDAEEKLRYH